MAEILIKGMEMPKNCEYCPLYDEEGICRLEPLGSVHWTRENNCPLVELPPHGDLIDADKLYERLSGEKLPNKVFDAIVNAPTVVPASEGE